jgi:hypothetical protein
VPVYLVVSLVTGILMRPDLFAFDKHGMPGNLVTLLTFDYAAVPIALFATIGTEMHFYALAPFLCLAFIPVADSTSQCII